MRIIFDRKKNKKMMKLYIYIYIYIYKKFQTKQEANKKNDNQIWKIKKIENGEIEKKIIDYSKEKILIKRTKTKCQGKKNWRGLSKLKGHEIQGER
jgi:hypothetical protein